MYSTYIQEVYLEQYSSIFRHQLVNAVYLTLKSRYIHTASRRIHLYLRIFKVYLSTFIRIHVKYTLNDLAIQCIVCIFRVQRGPGILLSTILRGVFRACSATFWRIWYICRYIYSTSLKHIVNIR